MTPADGSGGVGQLSSRCGRSATVAGDPDDRPRHAVQHARRRRPGCHPGLRRRGRRARPTVQADDESDRESRRPGRSRHARGRRSPRIRGNPARQDLDATQEGPPLDLDATQLSPAVEPTAGGPAHRRNPMTLTGTYVGCRRHPPPAGRRRLDRGVATHGDRIRPLSARRSRTAWQGRATVRPGGPPPTRPPDDAQPGQPGAGRAWWLPILLGIIGLLLIVGLAYGLVLATRHKDTTPTPAPTPTGVPTRWRRRRRLLRRHRALRRRRRADRPYRRPDDTRSSRGGGRVDAVRLEVHHGAADHDRSRPGRPGAVDRPGIRHTGRSRIDGHVDVRRGALASPSPSAAPSTGAHSRRPVRPDDVTAVGDVRRTRYLVRNVPRGRGVPPSRRRSPLLSRLGGRYSVSSWSART